MQPIEILPSPAPSLYLISFQYILFVFHSCRLGPKNVVIEIIQLQVIKFLNIFEKDPRIFRAIVSPHDDTEKNKWNKKRYNF